jgi:hypothetical protein
VDSRKKGGKRGRKVGRDKVKCTLYKAQHRREKNKARKLKKYLRKHSNDKCASKRLEELKNLI